MYDFCQNDGEVIETEEETPLYESVDDQEQVGCWYFSWRFFFKGLHNNY